MVYYKEVCIIATACCAYDPRVNEVDFAVLCNKQWTRFLYIYIVYSTMLEYKTKMVNIQQTI